MLGMGNRNDVNFVGRIFHIFLNGICKETEKYPKLFTAFITSF